MILEFWVKPSGILASKRYVRVFVDENGNITREDIPGKEHIGLPSIEDYKSNNYPVSFTTGGEATLLTSFCNTVTFTKYSVLASAVTPFATAQAVFNEPACGYDTQLPTPAIPPNPFGNADFGLYAYYSYCDIEDKSYKVNIYKRYFTGEPIQILIGDASPVKKIYTSGDHKLHPIRGLEFEFSFIAQEDFKLSNLYTFDEREFKLEHIDLSTNTVDFLGFITPDSAQEPFEAPPYAVKIRATDGLGALKTITYPLPVGSSTEIRQSFLHILAYALAMTNLNLDIMTICNLYATGMENGLDNDPLDLARVSPLRMTDTSGKVYSAYQALEAVCKQFGASIAQIDGVWRFFRVNEFAKGNARFRLYDNTARFKQSGTITTLRKTGTDLLLLDESPSISIGNAFKTVKVTQEFGRAPDIIYNGDFSQWDGQNFNFWTKYGGIKIVRVQKEIQATAGVRIPVEDWACSFLEKAVSGKWIESAKTWLTRKQTSKVSLNIGKTNGPHNFKVLFKIGQYYLSNVSGSFEWVTQVSVCTIIVDNTIGDIFSFAINIELPESPMSGDLLIQFFGFVKLEIVRKINNNVGQPSTFEYLEVNEYSPIAIDNIAITGTLTSDKKSSGNVHVCSQHGFYSEKPDETNIIWGEFVFTNINFNLVLIGLQEYTSAPQSQLQTIFLKNGDHATGWYEFGESNAPVPIGLCVARSILKAYQLAYNIFDCTLYGNKLSYLDSYNISAACDPDFDQKIFIWKDVTFDIKNREANGTLVEVFTKNLISNDYTAPQLPGSSNIIEPPIVQNHNPGLKLGGVFTEEFTTEFI